MEVNIKINTDNPEEAKALKRLAKSTDMASCLWELQHNFTRQWKDLDITLKDLNTKLTELFEKYKIDIDDLID